MIPPELFLSTRDWFFLAGFGEPVLGILMVMVGTLCLLLGWRVYRVLVLINVAVLCGLAGGWVMGGSVLGALGWAFGGVAGGILAWRFPDRATVVLGGMLGAYVCGHFLQEARATDQTTLVVAGCVFATVIAFGVIFVRYTIIVLSAFQGALLTIWGIVNMMHESQKLACQVIDMAINRYIFIPFTLMAVMMVGVFLQMADSRRQHVGMSG